MHDEPLGRHGDFIAIPVDGLKELAVLLGVLREDPPAARLVLAGLSQATQQIQNAYDGMWSVRRFLEHSLSYTPGLIPADAYFPDRLREAHALMCEAVVELMYAVNVPNDDETGQQIKTARIKNWTDMATRIRTGEAAATCEQHDPDIVPYLQLRRKPQYGDATACNRCGVRMVFAAEGSDVGDGTWSEADDANI